MTQEPLTKRDREHEALPDSNDVREPKRFHGEETDRFLHLLQLDQTLVEDYEEEFAPSEENGVMRSLEENISTKCYTKYNSAGPDLSGGHEGQTRDSDSGVDLCYLLEASDDELGIPPSPVLDLKEEVCQSSKETSDSWREKPDLNSLCENWHFEDDVEDYQEFALHDHAWVATTQFEDYIYGELVSQAMLFDGDFSAS